MFCDFLRKYPKKTPLHVSLSTSTTPFPMKTPIIAITACIAVTSVLHADQAVEPQVIRRPIGIVERMPAQPRPTDPNQPQLLTEAQVNEASIQSILENKEAKTSMDKLKAAISVKSLEDALQHLSRATIETLADKIDFDKQQLLIFAWEGSGQDRIFGRTAKAKDELTTRFHYTPGSTEDLKTHVQVYSIPKDIEWSVFKQERILFRCGVGEMNIPAPEGVKPPEIKVEINGRPVPVQPRIEIK